MTELIRQNYIDKIFLTENLGHVIILTGLRYSGKSTILKQAYEYKKQKVPKEHIKFIDFKKIGYDKEKNKQILIKIIKHITENYEDNKYIFLDNLEYVEDWGSIVHYNSKYRYNINIYLTTNISNRRINKELNKITYQRIIEIFPFSYKESLEYYKLNSKEKLKLNEEELFEEYQRYGGLPEVLETDDLSYKKTIINWAYENTMYPQIYKLYFRDFEENLIKYLIEETGHIFPERIIQKFINQDYRPYFNIYNLSLEILEEYLSIATSINIIKTCENADLIGDKWLLSNDKHYVSDTSFYFLKTFPVLNSKEILESIIYIELLRRNFTVSRGVLKNDEITFVSKDYDRNITYIQFETTLKDEKIREKTIKKLKPIKNAPKYIISTDKQDYSTNGIKHMNIIDFLRNDNSITSKGETNGCKN